MLCLIFYFEGFFLVHLVVSLHFCWPSSLYNSSEKILESSLHVTKEDRAKTKWGKEVKAWRQTRKGQVRVEDPFNLSVQCVENGNGSAVVYKCFNDKNCLFFLSFPHPEM